MFSYTVKGLTLASELALPALPPGTGSPDVEVRLGMVDQNASSQPFAPGISWWAGPEEIQLLYRNHARVSIQAGRLIRIDPLEPYDEQLLRLILLGPALACLLHQRGLLVLHASSIAVEGGAAAFLGEKGSGKSTTAAALNARGYGLIADDILAVEMVGAQAMTLPGIPRIKLLPETASALGADPETLPRLHPNMEKRARQTMAGFSAKPMPLSRLYILADHPETSIDPLLFQEAFVELVRHSYVTRFNGLLTLTGTQARHFEQCARLVGQAGIFRLRRDSRRLPIQSLADLIEAHLTARN